MIREPSLAWPLARILKQLCRQGWLLGGGRGAGHLGWLSLLGLS
jgi:hypothetical protein